MNCKRTEELILTDYSDGRLEGSALKEVEEHIASCDACRALAETVASAGRILSAGLREEAPEGVWRGVKAVITADAGQSSVYDRLIEPLRYLLTNLRPIAVTAAAAALILLAFATSSILFNTGGISLSAEQDEIFAMISVNGDQTGEDAGFGTAVEQYFM